MSLQSSGIYGPSIIIHYLHRKRPTKKSFLIAFAVLTGRV